MILILLNTILPEITSGVLDYRALSSDYSKSVTVDAVGNVIIGGYFFTP